MALGTFIEGDRAGRSATPAEKGQTRPSRLGAAFGVYAMYDRVELPSAPQEISAQVLSHLVAFSQLPDVAGRLGEFYDEPDFWASAVSAACEAVRSRE